MPVDIKKILADVLERIDQEERNDLLLELKDKKLTSKELVEAIRDLPPDERASVREAFIGVAEEEGGPKEKQEAKKLEGEAEKEEEARGIEEKPPEKKSKTRPGRKHGRAYGWYVDENGKVKVSDVAQVYSGEDEPDEVELYPDGEEEEIEEEEDD